MLKRLKSWWSSLPKWGKAVVIFVALAAVFGRNGDDEAKEIAPAPVVEATVVPATEATKPVVEEPKPAPVVEEPKPAPVVEETKPVAVATPKPTKSLGERVFSSRLVEYVEEDDSIHVGFEAWKVTKDSILNDDVRKFMQAAMKETGWSSATVDAYGFNTDKYGVETRNKIYSITFTREDAEKVVDWRKAKLDQIGKVTWSLPMLR